MTSYILRLITGLVVFIGLSLATIAYAATSQQVTQICEQRAFVEQQLAEEYGETANFIGVYINPQFPPDQKVVAIYRNEREGTFSIIEQRPGTDYVCLIAAGSNWSDLWYVDPWLEIDHIDP